MSIKIIELSKDEITFVSGGRIEELHAVDEQQIIGLIIGGLMLTLAGVCHLLGAMKESQDFDQEKAVIDKIGCHAYSAGLIKRSNNNPSIFERYELKNKWRTFGLLCLNR